jgi:hypothetical protein
VEDVGLVQDVYPLIVPSARKGGGWSVVQRQAREPNKTLAIPMYLFVRILQLSSSNRKCPLYATCKAQECGTFKIRRDRKDLVTGYKR